jgi:hypothetical protein
MDSFVDFEHVFDNIVETTEIREIIDALIPILDVLELDNTTCIAIDTSCFTVPYQPATIDMAGLTLYNTIVDRGVKTCLLSWMKDLPENVNNEMARLTAFGVDVTTLLMRAADFHKKTLAWNEDIATYTRDRTRVLPYTVVMYIGRYWVDVLPPDTVLTAMPRTSVNHHLLCRHIATNTWSLRLSPNTM